MYLVDINTLFVTLVLTGMAIAAILAVVGWSGDRNLLYWAAGYGVNSVAYGLIALRGFIPDFLSILLANALIVATYAFYAHGLQIFLNKKIRSILIWGPVIIVVAVFPFLQNNLNGRMIISGLINTYQAIILVTLLTGSSTQLVGRGKYILMAAFVAGILVAASRPLAISTGLVQITSFNSPGVFQNLTFLPLLVINIAIALGLVLMQREQAEATTSRMARSDDLTGLPNRRSIYEHISHTMRVNEEKQRFGALLLIDLNNFKAVNDQHGHAIGDELLCQAANRIQGCLTGGDIAARLGGDEFVVLLPDLTTSMESAVKIASEKVELLQEKLSHDYLLGTHIIHKSSGSIGLAMFEPGMNDRESLLRDADQAMYRAKKSSRITVRLDS